MKFFGLRPGCRHFWSRQTRPTCGMSTYPGLPTPAPEVGAVALGAADRDGAALHPSHKEGLDAFVLVHEVLNGGFDADLAAVGEGYERTHGPITPAPAGDVLSGVLDGLVGDALADRLRYRNPHAKITALKESVAGAS